MSVPFPGFCGPTYNLDNRFAAIERCVNWYPQPNESAEEGKYKMMLAPSPANAQFGALPVPSPFNQPNRGLIEYRGTVYGVNGSVFFSMTPGGGYNLMGSLIQDDGKPVNIIPNGNGQIAVISAGELWLFTADGSIAEKVTDPGFLGAYFGTFQDGYLIVLNPNQTARSGGELTAPSNVFQISGNDDIPLGDFRVWDAANISVQAGQEDYLRAIKSSREYLRLFGYRRSQIYQNVGPSGIGGFPFQSYNETFIETGIAAAFSLSDLGDSLIWIGEDARGQRSAWRDSAFQPQRVSTFAVEQQWQSYDVVSDAVAFPMIWQGHLQWQVTFPTAQKTWVYDITASTIAGRHLWHERQYLNARNSLVGRPELFHCFGYGKHLVGSGGADGNPGAIYQYSSTDYADCGVDGFGAQSQRPIVRDRICPHLDEGQKRLIINRLLFQLAVGVGLDGDAPVGVDPQLLLRWSKDGGNTFGPEQNIPIGKLGQYNQMVYWNRLGYARDFVVWIRMSDPVFSSVINAYLDIQECAS